MLRDPTESDVRPVSPTVSHWGHWREELRGEGGGDHFSSGAHTLACRLSGTPHPAFVDPRRLHHARGQHQGRDYGRPGSRRRVKVESKPVSFRPGAAQPFDDRCLSWQYDAGTVSIWTVAGRLKNIRFACYPDALKMLREYRRGESDLIERDGVFYLVAVCDIPERDLYEPAGFVGVDLGIVNIATTSTGYRAAGRGLNRHRARQSALRGKLQAEGTKSAKRLLKKRSRKEARHTANINHIVSKTIVTTAERTGLGIALEVLTGIRGRVRLRKDQRFFLHSWAFAQLAAFTGYKARRAGVRLCSPACCSRCRQ